MGQLILSIIVNGLMALLLVVTIVYCSRLNRRIKVLQDSKSELANIIRDFDESTRRATDSIGNIHEATARLAENIQHKIDKANYLADDLQFMIEKGNKVADKMEGKISVARTQQPAPAPRGGRAEAEEQATAIQEEVAALRRTPAAQAENSPRTRPAARSEINREPRESRTAAPSGARNGLDSVLNKISGRKPAETEAAADDKSKRPMARMRSKAEQELFDALKTGNKA